MTLPGGSCVNALVHSSEPWSRRSARIRVTRACDRCKKRKVRCTGQRPCHVCMEASVTCSYNASYTRGRRPTVRVTDRGPPARLAAVSRIREDNPQSTTDPTPFSTAVGLPAHQIFLQADLMPTSEPVSRTSPEPAEADLEGHYVGPSSGLAFLARVQKRFQQTVALPRGISVFNFGDSPLPYDDACSLAGEAAPVLPDLTFGMLLDREDTAALVRRYFDFAVPVDRFLHRPTVEQWFDQFYETRGVMRDRDAAPAQTAVLFMIFAVAQEHTVPKLSAVGANTSGRYFRAANQQLSKEGGPVRLASIQARLCQCLWLLSQSRINHCWSLFGTVSRLIFALGLHRQRHARSSTMTQVEIECRRRTFWSAYSLDNYLSTALGRPRTFNDKDIDQQFPSCVDDQDIPQAITSHTFPGDRGLSTMFGPISYAKLSQILSGVLSDIYSIKAMSVTERFSLTAKYMTEVRAWHSELSGFLGQRSSNAAPLVLIYQRQQNILNLAYWHTVILINRPLLLANFARLTNRTSTSHRQEQERQVHVSESIDECLNAAMEIVRVVDRMIQANQLFRAFWFTPYFAFSASVILYVYSIQHSNEPSETYSAYFTAAERCQQQIFDTSEPGSLTARYCLVLEELRGEALRQIATAQLPENFPTPTYRAVNTMSAEGEGFGSNAQDIGDGFPIPITDLDAMGNLGDFHLSPSDSLEDLTSWGQFESMVYAVTGAASGIGLATAKLISARGGIVCIADVDANTLRHAESHFSAQDPPVEFMATQVDVSSKQQVEHWIAEIKARYHRLDGAANVAGIIGKDHGVKSVAQLDDDEWIKILNVNLTGLMYCLRAELNHISDGGSIVNMASIHATTGVAYHGAYAASKHGVLGLTRVAAKENGHREVRINAVAPGPIYTSMMQAHWDQVGRASDAPFDDPIAFKRQGTAEEVAKVILFLLGPESSFVSGSCYSVDGAWI
ncbi:hypothetical protein BJY00DRAFT_321982 [Aspergillus carlsbadensis]|nr:hypothetical protein BJY00DRAFT_321982 [Aspergillus carlsbadensis]